ncbi:hypothetical protein [Synechococcus sp. CBW1004]|uniref:hypothetical protein n=1 Tax=Synechococcus sp. CBW1004 TaxID=1353136 RepID=UPI0018CDAFAD|nr:hypothetical protein [Synechococcus sp. CBW1004]QPN64295.1 hypothetical protein H8F25_05920 [Synechococcus sp. CBW1004]
MINLLLALLLASLALVLVSGDWRKGLLLTVVMGFAQDPIRKLTPDQPALYVGLALIAFVGSAIVLYQRRGSLELPLMFASKPGLVAWVTPLLLFLALQALNGLLRWGLPIRVMIGMGFYLAPLLGLWVGFQLGRDQLMLRRLLQLYLTFSSLFAFTALLDYRGVDVPLFDAIGGAQLIHFRYGFYTTGAIGLWRSTDIAAIHLTIAACIAVIFAFSGFRGASRNRWLILAASLATISLFTGRRKAIVQFVVFIGLFVLLLSRYGSTSSRRQLLGAVVASAGLAAIILLLDPSELLGDDFSEYVGRAATAPRDLWERFNALGLRAFLTGLNVSGGLGLGVGSLAQTGAAQVGQVQVQGANLIYVSESGIGKVVAELGIPGLILIIGIIAGLFQVVLRNLRFIRLLPKPIAVFEIGLLAFALSNLPFFTSAAGVYGDPFVLILCSISLGSVLAIPCLLHQQSEILRVQQEALERQAYPTTTLLPRQTQGYGPGAGDAI